MNVTASKIIVESGSNISREVRVTEAIAGFFAGTSRATGAKLCAAVVKSAMGSEFSRSAANQRLIERHYNHALRMVKSEGVIIVG